MHYARQTVNDLGRCKQRRTAAEKKEEAKKEQKKKEEWDSLVQKWICMEWEQEEVERWRQELKMRELAVAARETTVFQRELEYRRLERWPLCR